MSLDIQRILEDSIPEVEDLVDRGLLSKDEVGAIISKRREFETRVHRFEVLKSDYLQYIEYELNLDKLLVKRKQRLNVKRKGPGDVACIKRVNFIFDRALKKFQGDVDLWVAAIEFAQVKHASSRISKLLGQAIRIFPHREGFWILAASYEFETNKNVAEARAVMMQALRVSPKSETLWTEYFKLEFLFLHQILERRSVLGLETGEEEPIVRGDVLKIIYRKAVEAIPESLEFRLGFVREAEVFETGSSSNVAKVLIDFMLSNAKESFGSRPLLWLELSKRASSSDEAEKIIRTGCTEHPSAEMWEMLIKHAAQGGDTQKVRLVSREAYELNLLSENAAGMWLEVLTSDPQPPRKRTRRSSVSNELDDLDVDDLLDELTKRFPTSSRIWAIKCQKHAGAAISAAGKVRAAESLPFWEMVIKEDPDKLYMALTKLARQSDAETVIESLITRILDESKLPSEKILTIEKKALNRVPLLPILATLNREQLAVDEKRKLLEMCIERYPQCKEAWKLYIAFEKEGRDSKRIRNVTMRAIIALPEMKDELL